MIKFPSELTSCSGALASSRARLDPRAHSFRSSVLCLLPSCDANHNIFFFLCKAHLGIELELELGTLPGSFCSHPRYKNLGRNSYHNVPKVSMRLVMTETKYRQLLWHCTCSLPLQPCPGRGESSELLNVRLQGLLGRQGARSTCSRQRDVTNVKTRLESL